MHHVHLVVLQQLLVSHVQAGISILLKNIDIFFTLQIMLVKTRAQAIIIKTLELELVIYVCIINIINRLFNMCNMCDRYRIL